MNLQVRDQKFESTTRFSRLNDSFMSASSTIAGSDVFTVLCSSLFQTVEFIDFGDTRPSASDPDDAWFFTEEWQQKERRADENFKRGAFTKCDTIDEVISFLHDQAKKNQAQR